MVPDFEIENLTQDQILDKINNYNLSGLYLQRKDFSSYIGDLKYDSDGRIVGAKATLMQWFGKMNGTEALTNPVVDRDEPVDRRTLDFEEDLIQVLLNRTDYPAGLESFPNVPRSFGDISFSTIADDVNFSAASFAILMIYIFSTLGKFSFVDGRTYLTIAGLVRLY